MTIDSKATAATNVTEHSFNRRPAIATAGTGARPSGQEAAPVYTSTSAFYPTLPPFPNPTVSECSTFEVTPEHYGFSIIETGGGCTAWYKKLDGEAYLMATDMGGVSHELGERGETFSFGYYVDENDDVGGDLEMQVGILDPDPASLGGDL